MKKLFKNFFLVTLFFLLLTPLLTTHSQEDVKNELTEIENERNQRVEEQLLLNLPEISDNPNHIITFKDPSGNGIFLEIDGQEFVEIKSPFTLPSLGLGKHILTFKFSDEQKTEQILERAFTVIPRPPVLNPPSIVDNEVIISGTSISNSKVDIFLSRDIYNEKVQTETNGDGDWEYIFTENIEEGIYTIIATTRKNGLASNSSEAIVFTVGDDTTTPITEIKTQGIQFNFKDIDFSNYKNIVQILKTNTDLSIALGIVFLLGVTFAWLLISVIQRIGQGKSKKVLRELLKNKTAQESGSLKEKFENSKKPKEEEKEVEVEVEVEEEAVEEEKKEEEVEEEVQEDEEEEAKSLTKDEFLKNFKDFDPDDEEGEEKDLKKKKKNFKISLTSKG